MLGGGYGAAEPGTTAGIWWGHGAGPGPAWQQPCAPLCAGEPLVSSLPSMRWRRSSSEHGNSPQQGCPSYPGLPCSLISATSIHEVTAQNRKATVEAGGEVTRAGAPCGFGCPEPAWQGRRGWDGGQDGCSQGKGASLAWRGPF